MRSASSLVVLLAILTPALAIPKPAPAATAADAQRTAAEAAGDEPSIHRAMELNRAGRWEEAARVARRFLESARPPPRRNVARPTTTSPTRRP